LLDHDGLYAAMWQRQQEAGPDADVTAIDETGTPEPA
jgi:hypothetical protein